MELEKIGFGVYEGLGLHFSDNVFNSCSQKVCTYRGLKGNNRRKRSPIRKLVSVSVSFCVRVRVVRASERARRRCVGV